ncbi:uncharacterized protein A4U43_C03F17830 [Asparagus officinalis]|uniref:DUF632 domain-containing protein n=1 Tax=Asparagus officinalis TaxID=4686 RepID=A0A5P1FAY2_ASPOF|nr:uncharacterized protein LOC109833938 [Asparagus officinalis]ONK75528.1 uncharacterized protein A4U43_C03F17830 [Asparagus officinalis]
MGVPSSKPSSNEALVLCRERTRSIKQAIDSRYALSAAHLSYLQSLKSVGTALRRFSEAEISIDPSISTLEPDRTPSRSSYASSSPVQMKSPLPRLSNVSYMKASSNAAVTVAINPATADFVREEEIGSSWDFFDPNGENFSAQNSSNQAELVPFLEKSSNKSYKSDKSLEDFIRIASGELQRSNILKGEVESEEVFAEREDASEFITHRAKDFLSSMKDIEHRFLRAAESGNEVSRLLETSKIRLRVETEITGKSPPWQFLSTFHEVCCKAETVFKHEPGQNLAKVITWNRSVSSMSSSSKTPIGTTSKDMDNESDCSFFEEFCMISGSHSSTLDRLYAWERKLYDEVKATESLRKAYDQKCNQLRHQFARGLNPQVIDKTRAVVKDLHSQITVAIQTVDSISKKIEKMRDEELQPQLMELLQGLIRMWKAMVECHHTQFIIISLAYHVMNSKSEPHNETLNQAFSHLHIEIKCFASSFMNLVEAHKSYVEALNSWIHKCISQPQEQSKGRRKAAFRSRQSLSLPPIFVLCQHWLNGIKSLPSKGLHDSIRDTVSILYDLGNEHIEEKRDKDEDNEAERFCEKWSLDGLQTGLRRVFDQLVKFSEASVKVFEEVKQANETACIEYCANGTSHQIL